MLITNNSCQVSQALDAGFASVIETSVKGLGAEAIQHIVDHLEPASDAMKRLGLRWRPTAAGDVARSATLYVALA